MPGTLGDIVVSAGIDSRRWYEEAAALGRSASELGGKLREGLSGGGHGIGGGINGGGIKGAIGGTLSGVAAGAITDGPIGAVNQLESTANSALGELGWKGAAVAAAVAVAINRVREEMQKSTDAFDKFAESAKSSVSALDGFLSRNGKMAEFSASVGKIGTIAALNDAIGAASRGVAAAELEFSTIQALMAQTQAKIDGLNRSKDELSRGTTIEKFFNKSIIDRDIDPALKTLGGVMDGLKARERTAAAGVGDAVDRRAMLENERSNVEMRERSAVAQRIRDADPILGAEKALGTIGDLAAAGAIERDVGIRRARQIVGDFRKQIAAESTDATSFRNTAAVGGTSSGFSALQESIRGQSAELTETGRESVQALNSMEAKLQRIVELLSGAPVDF